MSGDLRRLLADVHRAIGVIDAPDEWRDAKGEQFTMDSAATLKTVRAIFVSGNWTNHPDYPGEKV